MKQLPTNQYSDKEATNVLDLYLLHDVGFLLMTEAGIKQQVYCVRSSVCVLNVGESKDEV